MCLLYMVIIHVLGGQCNRPWPIYTARRYAKRGTCHRRVSVRPSVCMCVCVCHTPVLYENG